MITALRFYAPVLGRQRVLVNIGVFAAPSRVVCTPVYPGAAHDEIPPIRELSVARVVESIRAYVGFRRAA